MAASFFFYDLETSGFNPRSARVMQFAGQRTDMNLQPIGDPVNVLIKLSADVVPDPDAVLVTGITPQQTLADGITEAEFLKLFYEEVVKPDTIFTGFNTVRFDDEFMRFLHYRNFYDPYEWHWKDGCSRWDILDVARMTRALRPDGIEWPYASDGKPTNRLEFLTKVNKLDHSKAHDALNDVFATIAVARLIREKQPELFEFLLRHRDKRVAKALVENGQPFVYTSGRYSSQYLHTTAAILIGSHLKQDAGIVYDLRFDPKPFIDMSVDQLIEAWRYTKDPAILRLPVKTVKYNRVPAIAPLGVIKDKASQERIGLTLETIETNRQSLRKHQTEFADRVTEAIIKLDKERERTQLSLVQDESTVDERLYDGFIDKTDAGIMRAVRVADPAEIADYGDKFQDARLKQLLPLYKARNYPQSLSAEERAEWDKFCKLKLLNGGTESRLAKYFSRLQELAADTKLSGQKQYLLEELQLYGESIIPAEV
jgi:exodeoxyribonuclease-1